MPVFPAVPLPPGTPGELVVADYQYEYNGIVMGAFTQILVENIEGLLSMPDLNRRTKARDDRHGSWDGNDFMEGREISFDVQVLSDIEGDAVEVGQLLDELAEAFYVDNVLRPFVYQRPGQQKRMLMAKPTERDFDSDYKVSKGMAGGSVQLYCPDPHIYSFEDFEIAVTLPIGATSGEIDVVNAGRVPSYKSRLVINGPATNPGIANDEDDTRQVKLDLVLGVDEILTIDMETWSADVDGVDVSGIIRDDAEFWKLVKGNNTLTYTRDAGNTGSTSTMTVYWKQAWI